MLISNSALHQPFLPPVPQINHADNSLSFLDDKDTVVDPENISDNVIPDTPPECVLASTPSHVGEDVISNTTELIEVCDFMHFVDDVIPNSSLDAVDPFISINVDDNDLDKLVNTDLAISLPGVVVSPSYKEVLLRESSPNQSIHTDILFPSPSSPELLDPSHDSSHVVDDVKCITPSPPPLSACASSLWVNGGESRMDNRCDQSAISVLATNCLDAQKLEDITPKSSYSDPHLSDRADVLVKVMNPPVPTSSPVKEIVPSVTSPPTTTIAGNSPVVRKKLFDTPPTPRLLKSPCSSSESLLSVSPDDPPSQKKLLLGSPPPNPYHVFPPNLPVNDLRDRLIQGLRAYLCLLALLILLIICARRIWLTV